MHFWYKTLHVSDSASVHHQEFFTVHIEMVYVRGLLTACEQDQDGTELLCDIYHYCVCSEKLLMMDRGTVQNS